ncbi:MAG: DUF1549 domain-containing protein [Planctomycetota bacterium]|nr:MAG: DUF1549 domain-containing protein [Planctomycetota bacterium]
MRWRAILPAMLVVGGVAIVTAIAVSRPIHDLNAPSAEQASGDLEEAASRIDTAIETRLTAEHLVQSEPAEELAVLRRLSLALIGTIPSLEEIRRFEADRRADRLTLWTNAYLNDPRFADYFAERLARAFVGVEGGQFVVYRRDRFTSWLADQIRQRTPYDEMVRSMLSETGVATDRAAVNFAMAAFANSHFDPNKLAGRTVRAFLGQRIDCAQCHNHPFSHWKQKQFEGLAACFGELDLTLVGAVDRPQKPSPEDESAMMALPLDAYPAVPFSPEWFPAEGSPRTRLAEWVTHPDNQRFERAIANRVWGLMFGKPYLTDRPVDDLPDPDDPSIDSQTDVLAILGADFRAHGSSLHRMIQVITATRAFRRSSTAPDSSYESSSASSSTLTLEDSERLWGIFPLVRLRPEQMIGSMLQSNSVQTIDQNSHLFTRTFRLFRERDYINEFGDPGEAELEQRTATITQTLLNMNGEFASEMSRVRLFSTPQVLRQYSPTTETLLDNLFLTCFTRRPTSTEREYFRQQLPESTREIEDELIEDIFWTLYNSPEFCWNH